MDGTPPSRELLLLRHAKSAWDTPAEGDFDRPLAGRGKRDAPRVGAWLRERGLVPDDIVSSPARRARQTARRVAKALDLSRDAIRFDERIYAAGLRELLQVLADCRSDGCRVLLVGHNPGLETLLAYLAAKQVAMPDDGKLLPTATLAHLRLPASWIDLAPGVGTLLSVVRPRQQPSADS